MGIIAVSDVHLGYSLSDKENFGKFLDDLAKKGNINKNGDINHFVICGDLLDMWRRDMAGVTIENLDILSKLQNLKNLNPSIEVHYLGRAYVPLKTVILCSGVRTMRFRIPNMVLNRAFS